MLYMFAIPIWVYKYTFKIIYNNNNSNSTYTNILVIKKLKISDPAIVYYIMGQRGTEQIVFRKYLFMKYRENNGQTKWKCSRYNGGLCKARCTTTDSGDIIISSTFLHTHPPDLKNILRKSLLYEKQYKLCYDW